MLSSCRADIGFEKFLRFVQNTNARGREIEIVIVAVDLNEPHVLARRFHRLVHHDALLNRHGRVVACSHREERGS